MLKIPPYLKKGDRVGITCPAGYMEKEKALACITALQDWGYEVMIGKTLGSNSENYFSGTDEMRLNELQAMLDDESIKAVLCARGGYGTGRIIEGLSFKRFKKNPKWIIGYSDITILHSHLHSHFNIASLHAPMASAFNDGYGSENLFISSLKKALQGKAMKYSCPAHPLNRSGKVKGSLVGGNLALVAHLVGTSSDLDTRGKILFLEDVGEYIYNVDRMLYQLYRSGKLEKLAGLIVGGFTDMKDTVRPFGKDCYQAISDMIEQYDYPVCFNFPVGHTHENYALKTGVVHRLAVTRRKVLLSEDKQS